MATDITPTTADIHLIADLQVVADLRAQLSDELGRITNIARERALRHDFTLHALALCLAGHAVEAVHLKFQWEAGETIPFGAIDSWIERAMTLLLEVKAIHTPWQPRNDISPVQEHEVAREGVAA